MKGKDCGVACDWCDVWHHAKYVGVSKEDYEVLCNIEGSRWFCRKCIVACEKFKMVFEEMKEVKINNEKMAK